MTENDMLMKQAESHGARRRVLLVVNALSYIAWIGLLAANLSHVVAVLPSWFIVTGLAGALVWIVSLVMLLLDIRGLRRNRALAGLVDDERTQVLRGRAFEAAYWVIMAAVALLLGLSGFAHLDARLMLPALAAIGVATPGLTFAWLYRA